MLQRDRPQDDVFMMVAEQRLFTRMWYKPGGGNARRRAAREGGRAPWGSAALGSLGLFLVVHHGEAFGPAAAAGVGLAREAGGAGVGRARRAHRALAVAALGALRPLGALGPVLSVLLRALAEQEGVQQLRGDHGAVVGLFPEVAVRLLRAGAVEEVDQHPLVLG